MAHTINYEPGDKEKQSILSGDVFSRHTADSSTVEDSAKKTPQKCQQHGCELTLFCRDCQEKFCLKCYFILHSGHTVVDAFHKDTAHLEKPSILSSPRKQKTIKEQIHDYTAQINHLSTIEDNYYSKAESTIREIQMAAGEVVRQVTSLCAEMVDTIDATLFEARKQFKKTRNSLLEDVNNLLQWDDSLAITDVSLTTVEIQFPKVIIEFERIMADISRETLLGNLTCVPQGSTSPSPSSYETLHDLDGSFQYAVNELRLSRTNSLESLHSKKTVMGTLKCTKETFQMLHLQRFAKLESRYFFVCENINPSIIHDLIAEVQKIHNIEVTYTETLPRYWMWQRHQIVFFRVLGRFRDDLGQCIQDYKRTHFGDFLMVAMHVTYPHRIDAFEEPIITEEDDIEPHQLVHILYSDKHGIPECPINAKNIRKLAEFVCGDEDRIDVVSRLWSLYPGRKGGRTWHTADQLSDSDIELNE